MPSPGRFTRLLGTMAGLFQFGPDGPMWKRDSAAVEARNAAATDFAIVRGAEPVGMPDLATKHYVDTLSKPIVASQEFDGNNALPANTGTEQVYVVTTTGANASVGELIFDDGSGAGTATVLAALSDRVIFTHADFLTGVQGMVGRLEYVWRTSTSAWEFVSQPPTLTLHIDPAGNAAANGLSPGHPTTFAVAVARAATNLSLKILSTAGTYGPSVFSGYFSFPAFSLLHIEGVFATVLSGTAAAGTTTSSVAVTGGGMVVNAEQGSRCTFSTGPNTGKSRIVSSNTVDHLLFDQPFLSASVAGNAFVLERPNTIFQMDNSANDDLWFDMTMDGSLWLDTIKLSFTGTDTFDAPSISGGRCSMTNVEIDLGTSSAEFFASYTEMQIGASAGAGIEISLVFEPSRLPGGTGCYLHGDVTKTLAGMIVRGGTLNIFGSVLDGWYTETDSTESGVIQECDFRGANTQFAVTGGSITNFFKCNFDSIDTSVQGFGAAFFVSRGATIEFINTCVFTNITNGDCIRVNSALVFLIAVTGTTGNTVGFGLNLRFGGRANYISNNTVHSGAGDVSLGAAGLKTWAGLAGGYVSDLASGTPQMCYVAPAT